MTGVDLDPLRLAMAQANLQALGLAAHAALVQADLRQVLYPFALVRTRRPSFSTPPAVNPSGSGRAGLLRASLPASAGERAGLAAGLSCDCGQDFAGRRPGGAGPLAARPAGTPEVEFISLAGELKEAVLWFGPLASAERRATLLERSAAPAPASRTARGSLWAAYPVRPPDDALGAEALPLAEPQAYLYEPDPAVLRAGLVGLLGRQLGAAQLDPDIAYLTGGSLQTTPFARHWAVEAWFPFSLKRLRQALRERQVGRVTVKKRGSPLEPQQLIRDLRLQGSAERVIFLTHLQGRPIVILAYP